MMDEVDAVFVYRTDVLAESGLRLLFSMEASAHSPIQYPFALTKSGMSSPEARAFFEYLTSPPAQALFVQYGFVEGDKDALLRSSAIRSQSIEKTSVSVGPPLMLSLWIALVSLLVSIVPAIGLGWLLARKDFLGKSLLSTLCLSPLVLPPVVTGVLLLRVFGRTGLLGPWVEALGFQIAFTRWAAVVAAAVVGFPLLLILVRQAIESVDVRYEQLAQTMGLSRWQSFCRVTLPMALPGIAAGCVLAFARAMGEFGATAMVAGDQPEETRTIALAVYALAERPGSEDGITTLVWWSLGISLCALFMFERLVWRQRRLREDKP
jgi:molybdate transport system permease protein